MRENVSENWRNIPDCSGQPEPEKIEIICSLLVINHQLWEYSLSGLAGDKTVELELCCSCCSSSWYSLLSLLLLLPLCMHLLLDYSLTLAS